MTAGRPVVGLLHPGAMGVAIGAALVAHGLRVAWASEGRSRFTTDRAHEAGLEDAGTLANLVRACDEIVSVVPPDAAGATVEAVLAAGFRGRYVDANAIPPDRARELAERIEAAGGRFVDGGIVGRPPGPDESAWIHLSGPDAEEVAGWFASGRFAARVLGDRIGDASALKVAFASWTKGATALKAAMLAYAEATGVREALRAQWDEIEPGFLDAAESRVAGTVPKAWRFEGEMRGIADAFAAAGTPDGFHLAAAEAYRRMAPLRAADAPDRRPEIEEVLAAMRAGDTDGGAGGA